MPTRKPSKGKRQLLNMFAKAAYAGQKVNDDFWPARYKFERSRFLNMARTKLKAINVQRRKSGQPVITLPVLISMMQKRMRMRSRKS